MILLKKILVDEFVLPDALVALAEA